MTNPLIPCRLIYLLLLTGLVFSCKQNNTSFTNSQSLAVKDTVLRLADLTARDISDKGPIAWLKYFEDSPDFFMASDGVLVFPSHSAADQFIKTKLVKQLQKINLKWSAIRVDPLTPQIAIMAANFHEDITTQNGKKAAIDGFFTATVTRTAKGWHFRDIHWSTKGI